MYIVNSLIHKQSDNLKFLTYRVPDDFVSVLPVPGVIPIHKSHNHASDN